MDRLYSKQILIIKAVFCFLLSPLYSIFSSLIYTDNVFLYTVLSFMPIACIFTVPFWITLNYIKKYRVFKISKYVILDFVSVIAPSFMGVLISEVFYIVSNGRSNFDGIVTVMFSFIFILLKAYPYCFFFSFFFLRYFFGCFITCFHIKI